MPVPSLVAVVVGGEGAKDGADSRTNEADDPLLGTSEVPDDGCDDPHQHEADDGADDGAEEIESSDTIALEIANSTLVVIEQIRVVVQNRRDAGQDSHQISIRRLARGRSWRREACGAGRMGSGHRSGSGDCRRWCGDRRWLGGLGRRCRSRSGLLCLLKLPDGVVDLPFRVSRDDLVFRSCDAIDRVLVVGSQSVGNDLLDAPKGIVLVVIEGCVVAQMRELRLDGFDAAVGLCGAAVSHGLSLVCGPSSSSDEWASGRIFLSGILVTRYIT